MLEPLVGLVAIVPPLALTVAGLMLGLSAAVAAAQGVGVLAVALLISNRLADGVDGEVARLRGSASDAGGYADIVVDTVVYAAIPLGAAAGSELGHIWPLTGLLLASFYVNMTTWTYLAAIIEKRRRTDRVAARDGDAGGGEVATTVVMPAGLIEGAETAVFLLVMLAFPEWLDWTVGIMAAAVLLSAGLRFFSGHVRLRSAAFSTEGVNV